MADTPLGRYVPLFKNRGQGSADLLSSTHVRVLLLRSINRWVGSCVAEAASLPFGPSARGEWPSWSEVKAKQGSVLAALAIFCVENDIRISSNGKLHACRCMLPMVHVLVGLCYMHAGILYRRYDAKLSALSPRVLVAAAAAARSAAACRAMFRSMRSRRSCS